MAAETSASVCLPPHWGRGPPKKAICTLHVLSFSHLTFFPKPPSYAPKRKLKLGLRQSFLCFLCYLSAGFWAALRYELCCLSCLYGRSLLVKTLVSGCRKRSTMLHGLPYFHTLNFPLSSLSGEAVPAKIMCFESSSYMAITYRAHSLKSDLWKEQVVESSLLCPYWKIICDRMVDQ